MSVLKQMLWDGVESHLVNQYSNGKISKGKLAELLNSDIYEVNEVLDKYHVKSIVLATRNLSGESKSLRKPVNMTL